MLACTVFFGNAGKRRQFFGLIGYLLVLYGDTVVQGGVELPRQLVAQYPRVVSSHPQFARHYQSTILIHDHGHGHCGLLSPHLRRVTIH